MHEEIDMLPSEGIISIPKLAKFLNIQESNLVDGLTKLRIPYVKLSTLHRHWLVRLEDLKDHTKEVR